MEVTYLLNPWESYHHGCKDGAQDYRAGFAERNRGSFEDGDMIYQPDPASQTVNPRLIEAYYHKGYRRT